MTQTQQPEALRLAEILEQYALSPLREVAEELRRQHARIEELEAQLSAIGAGGVEPLRKPVAAEQAAPNERLAFEAWLRVKPCGAAHDFAWEAWKARAALAATQPAAQGMALDAARWRMTALISRETMIHPDKRKYTEVVAAYMHAVHSGLDVQGAIDSALAAKAKQCGA